MTQGNVGDVGGRRRYTPTVRALVFDLSVPKYLLAKALGPSQRRAHFGKGTCVALRDVAAPEPPSGDWASLAPQLVGLCGTDLATIFFKLSPALSAVSSSPSVLGHEVFARLLKPPTSARDATGRVLREGTRVVLDPFVGCAARGLPEVETCSSCQSGHYSTCERAGFGPRKGVMLGAGVELPGGFAAQSIAHQGQIFSVDDRLLDDHVAALIEPLAVAVQAVSNHAPVDGRVLVLGGGPIGLATVWALHRLRKNVEITMVSLERYQLDHATRLGADHVLQPSREIDIVEQLALQLGSPLLRPIMGRPYLSGGFDAVFECVGTATTLDDALRVTRPRGKVMVLGCQGVTAKLDLTFVWSRELSLVGSVAYGYCTDLLGDRRRTFDVTIELAADDVVRLRPLVTHVVPLSRFGEAIEISMDRRKNQSVKALLESQK